MIIPIDVNKDIKSISHSLKILFLLDMPWINTSIPKCIYYLEVLFSADSSLIMASFLKIPIFQGSSNFNV